MFWKRSVLLLMLVFLGGPTHAQEEKEKYYVYSQKTGILSLDGKEIARGYSGKGEGLNNPVKEKVRNVGPIPAGMWQIGKAFNHPRLGPVVMPLTPIGHDAQGRDDFLIHGDNAKMNMTASEGCIILDRAIRDKIANSKITKLKVVAE